MKKIIGSILLLIVSLSVNAQTPPEKIFYDAVNSNWTARNYAQILTLINQRLSADSKDMIALSLKQYYFVYGDKDIVQAKQAATAFLNEVTSSTTNQDLIDEANEMAKLVNDIPDTASGPYTQAQADSLHDLFPQKFPSIDRCIMFAAKYEETM